MNINIDFLKFGKYSNNKLSRKQNNYTGMNLSTLKSDTFTFCGNKTDQKITYNLDDFEGFKQYLIHLTNKDQDNETVKEYIELFRLCKEYTSTHKNEESIRAVEKMPILEGLEGEDKFSFYIAEIIDVDDFTEAYSKEFSILKRMYGSKCKVNDLLDFYPLAKDYAKGNGIDSVTEINRYLYLCTNSSQEAYDIFVKNRNNYIGMKIYSVLDNKEDIAKYPEILLYLYEISDCEFDMSEFQPNEFISFLRKIGLEKFSDFDKKFDYLSSKYNDFEDTPDKYDAIIDIYRNYSLKIEYLRQLSKKFPEAFKDMDLQDFIKLYAKHNNIIDYMFSKQNHKDYKEKLAGYIDFLLNIQKLPEKTIKQIPETFGFKDSESIFNFMDIMAESNVTIDQLIYMSKNSIISDSDLFSCIVNKDNVTKEIAEFENIPYEEAENIYLTFANEYSVLINKAESKEELDIFNGLLEKDSVVSTFTNTLYKYGIIDSINKNKQKNTSPMQDLLIELGFGIAFNKKNQINSNTFIDIIGQLQLFNSKEEIIELAKKQALLEKQKAKSNKYNAKLNKNNDKITSSIRKVIRKEKKLFDNLKDSIKDYLKFNNSEFYAGKTILEMYKIFRNNAEYENIEYIANIDDTEFENEKGNLYKIVKNIFDYHKHGHKFDLTLSQKLENLIPDKKLLYSFKANNGISLTADNDEENERYTENCIRVLELFEGNLADNSDAITYFSETNFLKSSKNQLKKFFEAYPDKTVQKTILEAIANSKIQTMQIFNKFIKKYSNENGSYDNLIKFLINFPKSLDFQTFKTEFIAPLEHIIEDYNLPFNVNNDNILKISPELIKPIKECKQQEILEIINSISEAKNGRNFISMLPNTYIPKSDYKFIKKYEIAHEYVNQEKKNPYYNIRKFFNIDLDELGKTNPWKLNIETLTENKIPDDFLILLNDISWIMIDDFNIVNMPLHAKMRFIDRFILPEINDIKDLYSEETKAKMNSIIKKIYNKVCEAKISDIQFDKSHGNRFKVSINNEQEKYQLTFGEDGSLVTLFKKEYN